MSGPRVREHLENRELPGEIKAVLVISGAVGALGLLTLGLAIFHSGALQWDAVWVNVALTLSMAAVFLGLLPRTRWGWWYSTLVFGAAFALFLAAVVLSLMGSLSTLGRGCGIVAYASFTVVVGTPVWLLLRCRKRYSQLAKRSSHVDL